MCYARPPANNDTTGEPTTRLPPNTQNSDSSIHRQYYTVPSPLLSLLHADMSDNENKRKRSSRSSKEMPAEGGPPTNEELVGMLVEMENRIVEMENRMNARIGTLEEKSVGLQLQIDTINLKMDRRQWTKHVEQHIVEQL
jgi:hypothetical protein